MDLHYVHAPVSMQMVLLYHDPNGETLSGATTAVGITAMTTTQTCTQNNIDWESKVVSLEKTVRELRNEIDTLKVIYKHAVPTFQTAV